MADKLGTEVKVIRHKSGRALVEWKQGQNLRRSWVPDRDVLTEGDVTLVKKPSAGTPYGHNFTKYLTPGVTPDAIDGELKKRGIWTIEDLRANPNSALGALQSAYGVDLAALFRAADKYEAEEKKAAAKEAEDSGDNSDV